MAKTHVPEESPPPEEALALLEEEANEAVGSIGSDDDSDQLCVSATARLTRSTRPSFRSKKKKLLKNKNKKDNGTTRASCVASLPRCRMILIISSPPRS